MISYNFGCKFGKLRKASSGARYEQDSGWMFLKLPSHHCLGDETGGKIGLIV
jgi:hypothetical protein